MSTALQSSCELLRQRNMELYGTACKLKEPHAGSWNCMQGYGNAYKLMKLYASSCNALEPWVTLGNIW